MPCLNENSVRLSDFISVNVIEGTSFVLTRYGFIENCLRMVWGPRSKDERVAFDWIGGLGFAARRKKRRVFLWKIAQEIASRVGHGDEVELMQISPDRLLVPLNCVEEAQKLFGGPSE